PGGGILAGVDGTRRAVIRDMTVKDCPILSRAGEKPYVVPDEVEIELRGRFDHGDYVLELHVTATGMRNAVSTTFLGSVAPERLTGGIALVSHPGTRGSGARFWFRDLTVEGGKVEAHDDRTCGPILSTQYTLSGGVLKMTAQMMPLGYADTRTAALEILDGDQWKEIGKSEIVRPGYTASFRVENWDATKDTPYRIRYDLIESGLQAKGRHWEGVVRRDPVEKPTIVVAAFTGNHNVRRPGVDREQFSWTKDSLWFPHGEIVRNLAKSHKPDLLFFSGDQVYEGASPTGADKGENLELDYLYKWYLWCWAFRDLTKDVPCVCIPDDHDVYQGNLWGAGGRKAASQDDGGYTNPPEFVNMVQRTQTSHLPDPYDPTPVEQGIGVYYCAMNYGRVGFAILEDRKFKSSATPLIPDAKIVNGWSKNPDYDPAREGDVPGAQLLGQRQLDFLHNWATDWTGGACMKAVLSQTVFSNVATLPASAEGDGVVPGLERPKPGEYAENDKLAADADSNGWPQTGRNKALREMRRGFAVHIAGDQHLGSLIQYGVEDWRDGGFAFCVPSIANFFPRRWYPPEAGKNQEPGAPKYTGDYLDGFGNHMTVYAVANPAISGREPAALYDSAPGYGIVRFTKPDRTVEFECWPRYADPADPQNNRQYPGWPKTVGQTDSYNRKAFGHLPKVEVRGMTEPVIEVIREADDEIVYALRIPGASFTPKVFEKGSYTVRVGDPDTEKTQTFKKLKVVEDPSASPVEAVF
ncbi:MAG TPA: alkaline phosphatase D family protein, partial [Sumerlaeia bacterium]|nr:alkaline phosphatase D family protein [Sumerlaeia bacterium]